MAENVPFTKKDELQDEETARVERRVVDTAARIFRLESEVSALKARLSELQPLLGLIEFVESIKAQFANFRLK